MKALVLAMRRPDPLGPGDAKIASQAVEALAAYGAEVRTEYGRPPSHPAQGAGLLRALATGAPLQMGLTASKEFQWRVRKTVEADSFDVIVALHARAARYVPRSHRWRALALIVDALGLNYRTYRGRVSLPLDLIYRLEARRMERLEAGLMREFGAVAVVSPTDAAHLRAQAPEPERVVHLPYAVDLRHFTPHERPADQWPPRFLFSGRLSYLPNADAAVHLITRIWPALRGRWPEAELRVVGARPGARLVELAHRERVTLLADVPDVRVHLTAATAALVPMRLGGDTQTKVLEAMASGVPVVCASWVQAGLSAGVEEEVLLPADTPEEYVRQLERVIGDPEATRHRTAAARRLVEARHSPPAFGSRLAEVCSRLQSGQPQPHLA